MNLQPAQYWRMCLFLSIYKKHKLHPRLTQQNIYDFSPPPHCERPDGKHKPASKENHLQFFRQDHQISQSQGSNGGKSGSPPEEREQFHTGSSWLAGIQGKFPVLPVFFQWDVFSFHNGAKPGMFTQALPENIPKEMELNNTTALNLQHPGSISLAAAGEPWAKIQNRRQKTSQCKKFSISMGQSGCRNKFLFVLSYMSLQKWRKKSRFHSDTLD